MQAQEEQEYVDRKSLHMKSKFNCSICLYIVDATCYPTQWTDGQTKWIRRSSFCWTRVRALGVEGSPSANGCQLA